MCRNILSIILLILALFSCQNSKENLAYKIDYEELIMNRDLELVIYYKKFPLYYFDEHTSVKTLKEGNFDYKVVVNPDVLSHNIEIFEQINTIKLNKELLSYKFDAFTRCDFISTKYGLIYTFGLGSILDEDIVWINGKYYEINDKDYQFFNAVKDTFMPVKYAFPGINLLNGYENINKSISEKREGVNNQSPEEKQ